MKLKTVSASYSKLLEQLKREGTSFFSTQDVLKLLPDLSYGAVREMLRKMVNKGLLLRIEGGLYNVIPFEQDSSTYFPNWHQVAAALATPNEYYIGFYSALHIHSLITQPSLVEQVVTKKQILPKKREIKNVRFEFITFNEDHFFGFKKHWIDDYNQVYCSDLEKTIIDSLYKPDYSGGITEIVKAIYKRKDQVDLKKMEGYLERFNAQVVYKLLGFISEKLNIWADLRENIKSKITNSYSPLDSSIPKKGMHNSTWRIIDNLDIKTVISSTQT